MYIYRYYKCTYITICMHKSVIQLGYMFLNRDLCINILTEIFIISNSDVFIIIITLYQLISQTAYHRLS